MTQTNGSSTLYQLISVSFCVIVVISNIISAKMFKLPYFQDLSIPAGLVTYPLTFLLTDLVTEIYGSKKAKLMVYITFSMSLLSFAMIQLALILPTSSIEEQQVFQAILGLSGLRIFSSLIAYLISQVVDIQLYTWIKSLTGNKMLWLRNNVSTCLSQLVDTVILDLIFLYWGLGMPMQQVLSVMLFSFAFKAACSVINTPLFYLCVHLMKKDWGYWQKDWLPSFLSAKVNSA